MLINNELYIRPMSHDDLNLMVKWLNNEIVLKYYDEPASNFKRIQEKYGPRIDGKHYVIPYIVEYKNKSIGYIQCYKIQQDDLKKYGYTEKENIFGIDQFIGEPELWGKGIGSTMIAMILNELSNKGVSKVVLEVKESNIRAFSCYKKCGFRKVKELTKGLILMEWSHKEKKEIQ